MEKIASYPDCVLVVDNQGDVLFVLGLPDDRFDSQWLFDIGDGGGAPTEPGLYLADVEAWFKQGYSDGHKADGESDFELRITKWTRAIGVVI